MFVFSKKSSYLLAVNRIIFTIAAFLALFLFFVVPHLIGGNTTPAENKYVTCKISLEKQAVRAGSRTQLLISFTPQKGIHVNTKPPMSISFDSTSYIANIDTLIVPQSKIPDALDPSKVVKVPFRLKKGIQPGTMKLSGVLTYFYCSDAEGWCSKFKQPFEVTLNITK
jgi:hypothetical protein